MKNPFNINNWSKLSSDKEDHQHFLEQRRNVLFSRFCLASSVAAMMQGLHDLLTGFPFVMLLDIILAILMLVGYLMNEHRLHKPAKILSFYSMIILLFAFAAVVPRGVGMYLLFFPLVAFSFISFDYKDRLISYTLAFLALVLNVILVLTNYQPFGSINLQPIDPTSSFALNLLISITLIVLGIDFLLRINTQAEEKLIENQLETEKLAHEVNEKNQILEKTNEELDRFVYSTSHDLRSPLASIMGLISLTEMSKEPIPEEVQGYLVLMKDRINNLDGFIQDIIDYSRNTRVDLVLVETDIAKLVQDVVLNNGFLENAAKVKVKTDINIHKELAVDNMRLSRVLNNLVSNAIKYNDLQKENPCVTIEGFVEDSHLIIKVKDSGKGIHPDIQDKIFDMFYRGTDTKGGSGLGLYITREMVQKMKGDLSFTSENGLGTTFEVTIPLN